MTEMPLPLLRALERQLDRVALQLAFAYEDLLERLFADAAARRDLDPDSRMGDSLTAKAVALRELVRRLPPTATPPPPVVYGVLEIPYDAVLALFWTREPAEEWKHREGRTSINYEVRELQVEQPPRQVLDTHAEKVDYARQLIADVERELGPLPEQLLREVDEHRLEGELDLDTATGEEDAGGVDQQVVYLVLREAWSDVRGVFETTAAARAYMAQTGLTEPLWVVQAFRVEAAAGPRRT